MNGFIGGYLRMDIQDEVRLDGERGRHSKGEVAPSSDLTSASPSSVVSGD